MNFRLLLPLLGGMLLPLFVGAAELPQPVAPLAPPLVLQDASGRPHELESYKGQVVLVNFWATWCPPCREEMPSMQRLQEKLAGRSFVMLGVDSGESAADLDGFLEKVGVNFPILFDPEGAATRRWKVYALPTSFLIDRQGRVRQVITGPREWDGQEALSRIESLLAEP